MDVPHASAAIPAVPDSVLGIVSIEASRWLCQEARLVLTSLRGGPPHVARGELAQDLMDLRDRLQQQQQQQQHLSSSPVEHTHPSPPGPADVTSSQHQQVQPQQPSLEDVDGVMVAQEQDEDDGEEDENEQDKQQQQHPPVPPAAPTAGGMLARPFLQVVMDPRAAGPYTLVALRSIHRLLLQDAFGYAPTSSTVHPLQRQWVEDLTRGILACRFEQTDPGADEAVEMAIADVLRLMVEHFYARLNAQTLMEALNTVFVTRNTFVHSPALCYHFEDVLTDMVQTVFSHHAAHPTKARLLLEFLVNQLLHTPLVGGEGLDEATKEAQLAHDATRTLSLRLVRTALQHGWPPVPSSSSSSPRNGDDDDDDDDDNDQDDAQQQQPQPDMDPGLLHIIQDDLCLSLLMTGQAVWAYHDAHPPQTSSSASHHATQYPHTTMDDLMMISPGFISLEVLSEICATLSTLWNTLQLRCHLIPQFETIFTGFYTRALVLLRKRKEPTNSLSYNANLIFDAEVEIILESLTDILCLHPYQRSIADGDGGALETLFASYDCHMRRSDVAADLVLELCLCCGGNADQQFMEEETASSSKKQTSSGTSTPGVEGAVVSVDASALMSGDESVTTATTAPASETARSMGGGADHNNNFNHHHPVRVEHFWRPVPAHLKELCAQAIIGGMKCLFQDDKASAETLAERSNRIKSIMSKHVSMDDDEQQELVADTIVDHNRSHLLRDLKSRKRLMRKAARIFNKKASHGIAFLVDSGLVSDPVTPTAVAHFLRNAIVVGLDKKAVGAYLGEAGKSPVAGKSPPNWERDWFHKDVLKIYCSLFSFEGQSLLDGLRMFLAAFRLPGEAQQIDRILQAFADVCSQVCEEAPQSRLKLFSDDPKRASDAAYLLSFSIIMLNTDLHNDNIREDRKMSPDAFVKNNTDYGRDITERGKEFPRDYLINIYESIKEEEIRTLGEGSDGAITVERWRDLMRGGSTTASSSTSTGLGNDSESTDAHDEYHPSVHDAEDLSELVLEHVWKPIMSAIGALLGVGSSGDIVGSSIGALSSPRQQQQQQHASYKESSGGSSSMLLGVQGARLGMDMALEMLNGVRHLGRTDIFRNMFKWICDFTGLMGQYNNLDAVERTWILTNSVEAQSAVIVVLRTAAEAGEYLDEDGWRRVWSILFELRDLKLIGGGKNGILYETDPDMLTEESRRDWTMRLVKGDMEFDVKSAQAKRPAKKPSSVFGAFGFSFFGSDSDGYGQDRDTDGDPYGRNIEGRSPHGKECLVVWDESAPSEDEADSSSSSDRRHHHQQHEDPVELGAATGLMMGDHRTSAGAQFENLLVRESRAMSRQMDMPVTGLERVDETRRYQISPRARVRERLRACCSFESLVSDSRFMEESSVECLLRSLIALSFSSTDPITVFEMSPQPPSKPSRVSMDERSTSTDSASTASFVAIPWHVPVSPASEAFAEVLICELALKNKDRLKSLWSNVVQDHYLGRLTSILVNPTTTSTTTTTTAEDGSRTTTPKVPVDPGLEKRVTGLLRLSICAIQRKDIANEVVSSWKYLLPINAEQIAASPLRVLDRHMGEGLWRIVAQSDALLNLDEDGWEGLVSLLTWCGKQGATLKPIAPSHVDGNASSSSLPEDDPTLQCYRSLHLILNTTELEDKIPFSLIGSLRALVAAGESRKYPQLSIAALDLLKVFYEKKIAARQLEEQRRGGGGGGGKDDAFWSSCWKRIVEAIAEGADQASSTTVRQHALSMLTDLFLEKQGKAVPIQQLCSALSDVCVPLAGRCVVRLQMGRGGRDGRRVVVGSADELMIEFELCIGLIFKPLRHHLNSVLESGSLSPLWKAVLAVLEDLLTTTKSKSSADSSTDGSGGSGGVVVIPESLKNTMDNLTNEHLQNAIMALISSGVLQATPQAPGDFTAITWEAVSRMGISQGSLEAWKKAAAA